MEKTIRCTKCMQKIDHTNELCVCGRPNPRHEAFESGKLSQVRVKRDQKERPIYVPKEGTIAERSGYVKMMFVMFLVFSLVFSPFTIWIFLESLFGNFSWGGAVPMILIQSIFLVVLIIYSSILAITPRNPITKEGDEILLHLSRRKSKIQRIKLSEIEFARASDRDNFGDMWIRGIIVGVAFRFDGHLRIKTEWQMFSFSNIKNCVGVAYYLEKIRK
ncbi:MAG: hypothetical protein FWC11_02560 [Firmicutes bacterium]|nr:hypothetical protein [Bacillota bacterium]MCL2255721.1 hypothetical protein [Bacillota bacterium]